MMRVVWGHNIVYNIHMGPPEVDSEESKSIATRIINGLIFIRTHCEIVSRFPKLLLSPH